jgi:hypothetical protein
MDKTFWGFATSELRISSSLMMGSIDLEAGLDAKIAGIDNGGILQAV